LGKPWTFLRPPAETGDTQIQDVPKQGRLTSQGAGELHTLIWQACPTKLTETPKNCN
jgi:hypothetical protein